VLRPDYINNYYLYSRYIYTGRVDTHYAARHLVMGRLFQDIRQLVMNGQYLVGEHSSTRLDERGVLEWQLIDGIEQAQLLAERARSLPNPSVEVLQHLADGTEVKVVWSLLPGRGIVKLVTVHFFDEQSI
jgi:hypothetical protein